MDEITHPPINRARGRPKGSTNKTLDTDLLAHQILAVRSRRPQTEKQNYNVKQTFRAMRELKAATDVNVNTEKAHRRGRPRGSKNKTNDSGEGNQKVGIQSFGGAVARRGRPKGSKNKTTSKKVTLDASGNFDSATGEKRKRGRPRKTVIVVASDVAPTASGVPIAQNPLLRSPSATPPPLKMRKAVKKSPVVRRTCVGTLGPSPMQHPFDPEMNSESPQFTGEDLPDGLDDSTNPREGSEEPGGHNLHEENVSASVD